MGNRPQPGAAEATSTLLLPHPRVEIKAASHPLPASGPLPSSARANRPPRYSTQPEMGQLGHIALAPWDPELGLAALVCTPRSPGQCPLRAGGGFHPCASWGGSSLCPVLRYRFPVPQVR